MRNVRPQGAVLREMLVWRVAEIGRLNLLGLPHLRIGCWELADLSKRAAEN